MLILGLRTELVRSEGWSWYDIWTGLEFMVAGATSLFCTCKCLHL